jgi:hypothetical protein
MYQDANIGRDLSHFYDDDDKDSFKKRRDGVYETPQSSQE